MSRKKAAVSKLEAAERPVFEDHIRSLDKRISFIDRWPDDGVYKKYEIQSLWEGWWARAQLASEPEADERQSFEDYIRRQDKTILFVKRKPGNGAYQNIEIQSSWEGWLMRAPALVA